MALRFTAATLSAGVLAIPVVLAARLTSVGVSAWSLRRWERFHPAMLPVLTWGGLRGGISVALALSLQGGVASEAVSRRDVILATTYVVVVFSILVQGLTVGPPTRHWLYPTGQEPATDEAT